VKISFVIILSLRLNWNQKLFHSKRTTQVWDFNNATLAVFTCGFDPLCLYGFNSEEIKWKSRKERL